MQRLFAWILAAAVVAGGDRPTQGQTPKAAEPAARFTVVTAGSHCDWSWGHPRAWHEERYAETIRQVLLLMREHPRYVWQLENENEQLRPFLAKAAREWPELVPEFWRRVREGRIEVLVAITNPRVCEVYPELFVRNLALGKEYFRRHAPGIEQPVYQAVDLMAGHSQTPQILSAAGYRYFMFSRPYQKKTAFWRTGLDGTRMLSTLLHYSHAMTAANGVRLEQQSGDDILPDVALAKAAETWDPAQKILSTSARYFEELEKAGGTLPEHRGVLDSLESFCCGTGLHGNRNLYTWNNQHEDLLLAVEKARVMASASGHVPPTDAKSRMDDLWHDVLSCAGHAILWCWKDDYDERLAKVHETRTKAELALAEALGQVARRARFRADLGSPLMVFNFQVWPAGGPVEFVQSDPAGLVLRDASGKAVPLQAAGTNESGEPLLTFIAQEVPACGFKTYYLSRDTDAAVPVEPPANELRTIENERYRITQGPDGSLQVLDKVRGTRLGSGGEGLGDLVFYDTPRPQHWEMNGPLGSRHVWEPRADAFEATRGPVFSSLRAVGAFGPHAAVREVRLWRDSRRIDYRVEIDAREGCGLFFLRFPLEIAGRVTAGIPFGAEPRENLDQEPFRGEYFAQGYPDAYYATRWTDVSSDECGYTFVAPHGMHNGFQYKPEERALEFALLRVRPMPGGGWGLVHPSIQGQGMHRWHCALVPHEKTWREAATYRDALELHSPLMAFSPTRGLRRADASAAAAPAGLDAPHDDSASFAEVMPAGVVLSTLRCIEQEGTGQTPQWELRVYETLGRQTDAVIRLGLPIARARETNLLGEPTNLLGKIDVSGTTIRFRLPPWKIATLRIEPVEEIVR